MPIPFDPSQLHHCQKTARVLLMAAPYSFYPPPQWQLQWNFLGQIINYLPQPQLTNILAPVWTFPNLLSNITMPVNSNVAVTIPGPVTLAPGTTWAYSIPTAPAAPASDYAYSLPVVPPVALGALPQGFNLPLEFPRLNPYLPVIPPGPPPPLPMDPNPPYPLPPPPQASLVPPFPEVPFYLPVFDVLGGIPVYVA